MFDSIFSTTLEEMQIGHFFIVIGVAIILGLMNSFINSKTQKSDAPRTSMLQTLVILPLLVSIIILLVGSSTARALSLAGAFAIIRFRSPATSKDIAYVLLSMGIGLALGMGYIAYAVIVSVIFCGVMILLALLKYGEDKEIYKLLKIKVPENLNGEGIFDEILKKYTDSNKLLKMKTSDLGSIYELTYVIKEKRNINEKEMIDDLRVLNGNLTISIILHSVDSKD